MAFRTELGNDMATYFAQKLVFVRIFGF